MVKYVFSLGVIHFLRGLSAVFVSFGLCSDRRVAGRDILFLN